MSLAQNTIRGMIEGNLQQGWSLLDTEQWELAKHHFREAIEQVDQLAHVAEEDKAQQPTQIPLIDV